MASKWVSTESYMVPQDIDQLSTVQNNPLGLVVQARDLGDTDLGTGEFIYLPGIASNAVGFANNFIRASWATALVDTDSASALTSTIVGPVAIAMSASVASRWGWYQVEGIALIKTLASVAINKPLFPTATAGSLDDVSLSGGAPQSILQECVTMEIIDSDGYTYAYINHPVIAGVVI